MNIYAYLPACLPIRMAKNKIRIDVKMKLIQYVVNKCINNDILKIRDSNANEIIPHNRLLKFFDEHPT